MKSTLLFFFFCLFAIASLTASASALAKSVRSLQKVERRDSDDPIIPELIEQLGLTTLLDLAVKAELDPVLGQSGPFTVFGPTNDAFDNLPEVVKELTQDPEKLAALLLFHVLLDDVPSSDLKNELLLDTALDVAQLRINLYSKNGATVATAQCAPIDLTSVDNTASNGLVHVLNAVMIPPFGNIIGSLSLRPNFSILLLAISAANLQDALCGDGPFTVFAPTDEAFMKLPSGLVESLLNDTESLTYILEYHVVSGTFCSAGLSSGNVTTLADGDVAIDISSDGVTVNDANVIAADVSITNGVIHVIDTVLIPPNLDL